MIALNPITALRNLCTKSRRAPMPVSQRPRGKRTEARGPNPYTPAGTLFYNWFEHAARRKLAGPTMEQIERRSRTQKPRTRYGKNLAGRRVSVVPCDPAGSRAAERRKRQGAHLHQHPSVVARFANHPTQAEVRAEIARVEGGIVGKVKRALSPRKKKSEAA